MKAVDRLGYGLKGLLGGGRAGADTLSGIPAAARFLILRTDHLGDMVLTSSFTRNLKLSFPDSKVTVLCRTMSEPLARLLPGVDEVLTLNTPWLARADAVTFRRFLAGLRAHWKTFDVAFDLHPHAFNILLARALARRAVGFDFRGLGFLLDAALRDSPPGTHVVDRNLRLLETVGCRPADRTLQLPVSLESRERVQALLSASGVPREAFKVLIHPGAGLALRQWPDASFAELIDLISAKAPAASVILVDSDPTKCHGILASARQPGAVVDLSGRVGLLELTALIAECQVLVALDSVAAHLAAGVGTPVVQLYSGQNVPGEWTAYSPNCEIVRRPVACAPCGKVECTDNRCMKEIRPEEVFDAFNRLCDRIRGKTSAPV
jgi:heptosyltransferase-3